MQYETYCEVRGLLEELFSIALSETDDSFLPREQRTLGASKEQVDAQLVDFKAHAPQEFSERYERGEV